MFVRFAALESRRLAASGSSSAQKGGGGGSGDYLGTAMSGGGGGGMMGLIEGEDYPPMDDLELQHHQTQVRVHALFYLFIYPLDVLHT